MSAPPVLLGTPADGVKLIRINRLEAHNALNMAVRKLLVQHLLFSGQDQKEGMAAFIQKRKPKFEGK